jgi:hypothetical protein
LDGYTKLHDTVQIGRAGNGRLWRCGVSLATKAEWQYWPRALDDQTVIVALLWTTSGMLTLIKIHNSGYENLRTHTLNSL